MSPFFSAVQFLTRIPIPERWIDRDYQESLRRSLVYFPLVGMLIAIVTCLCFQLMGLFFPVLIAAFLAVSAEVVLTGGFHEDAFADTADALGGGWTREQVLEILKDSRHGTYGVLALVLGVGLRISLIANINVSLCWLAIPLSGCLGRWGILWLMHLIPPIVDRHTMVRDLGQQPEIPTVFNGILFALPGIGLAWWLILSQLETFDWHAYGIPIRCGLSLIGMLIVGVWYTSMLRRRVQGTTGDFLGAFCFLIQLTTLLSFACAV
jgi:adenosylcobinamide-GDP ribazoletransferase